MRRRAARQLRLTGMRVARRIPLAVAYCAGIIGAWWLAVRIFSVPSFLAPSPEEVFASLAELPAYYTRHFGVTFIEAVLGLIWGFGIGMVLGVLIRYGSLVGRLLAPIVLALQCFPVFALSPLLSVHLGYDLARVVVCGLIVLLPAVIHTWRGLNCTPQDVALTMHVMGSSGFQRFWFADRVFATPHVLAAWRQSSLLAVIGAVVGELSIPSSGGLAYVIQVSMQSKERVFACLILLGLMGGLFYGIAALTDMLVNARHEQAIANHRRKDHET